MNPYVRYNTRISVANAEVAKPMRFNIPPDTIHVLQLYLLMTILAIGPVMVTDSFCIVFNLPFNTFYVI